MASDGDRIEKKSGITPHRNLYLQNHDLLLPRDFRDLKQDLLENYTANMASAKRGPDRTERRNHSEWSCFADKDFLDLPRTFHWIWIATNTVLMDTPNLPWLNCIYLLIRIGICFYLCRGFYRCEDKHPGYTASAGDHIKKNTGTKADIVRINGIGRIFSEKRQR